MKYILVLLVLISFSVSGCQKAEDKKVADKQTPDLTPKSNMDKQTESGRDDKVAIFKKDADDAYDRYTKDKNETNKKDAVAKNLAAGNYMMFDADVPPKEKYRPALKFYRRVLEIDPKNQDATVNKDKIEEIYVQMGLPIPQ